MLYCAEAPLSFCFSVRVSVQVALTPWHYHPATVPQNAHGCHFGAPPLCFTASSASCSATVHALRTLGVLYGSSRVINGALNILLLGGVMGFGACLVASGVLPQDMMLRCNTLFLHFTVQLHFRNQSARQP